MFRVLKRGFVPHATICSNSYTSEEIRKQVILFSADISNQIYETGTAMIEHEIGMTEAKIAAMAEIVITELIYYDQIEKIGHFVASELVEKEEPTIKHSANLLIAISQIHQKILDVLIKLGVPDSQVMLGAAGYKNSHNESIQRYYYGLLLHSQFVLFGKDEIKTIDMILEDLCHIAKLSWTLMDLCSMCNAFQFAEKMNPLFDSIQIDPLESIFGNYGWKKESSSPLATNK
jgi:hypothetical protein